MDASVSELEFHMLDGDALNDGCFGIMKTEHETDLRLYHAFAAAAANDDSLGASLNDDVGDKAFGILIAEELRKMTPSDQHQFKRHVTDLLYS